MKQFFNRFGALFVVLAFFAALGGIGVSNSLKFRSKCEALGGAPVAYDAACVKPGSTIEVPR